MTAKDKAKELIEKYCQVLFGNENFVNITNPKKCALIAVDEIISAIKQFHTGAEWQLMETMAWTYWHKVKDEINAL